MKIAIGADHAGFETKERVKRFLEAHGHEVLDMGTHSAESTDYPGYAFHVAEAVRDGAADRGILVCDSGNGIAIAANKVEGIRAAIAVNRWQGRWRAGTTTRTCSSSPRRSRPRGGLDRGGVARRALRRRPPCAPRRPDRGVRAHPRAAVAECPARRSRPSPGSLEDSYRETLESCARPTPSAGSSRAT